MQKFTSFEKLQKKEQKRINASKRGSWNGVNPVSRMVPSGKAFNRERIREEIRKQSHDL